MNCAIFYVYVYVLYFMFIFYIYVGTVGKSVDNLYVREMMSFQ